MELQYDKDSKERIPYEHYLDLFQKADPKEISQRTCLPYDENTQTFTLQMMGVTYYIKHPEFEVTHEPEERIEVVPCPGCKTNNPHTHNGIQCKIMNWYSGYKNDKVGEVFFHTLIS